MRRLLALLLLWSTNSLADQPVLRFSVAESWSMPLVRIEGDQPVEGLLYDLMQAVARQVGARPEFHVMARLRLEEAMSSGDIDVRCYVSTQWLNDRPRDFVWSIPLIHQRDVLVGRAGDSTPIPLSNCHLRRSARCWATPIQPCNRCWTTASCTVRTAAASCWCCKSCRQAGIAMR